MTPTKARGALFVANSENSKLIGYKSKQGVATTYASIEDSCPRSCVLKQTGECYAVSGYRTGAIFKALDRRRYPADQVARIEANAIDSAFNGGPVPSGRLLRLHTGGDCRTARAASIVSSAIERWYGRGGGTAWTFTHAWSTVPRAAWKTVSVLASVDDRAEAPRAMARGYAPACYVAKFPSRKAWIEGGVRWIPCPAQTTHGTPKQVGCADCRLCLNADGLLARGSGIAFEAHGVKASKMRYRLNVVTASTKGALECS